MSISNRMGELIDIWSYNGLLHSNENEQNTHIVMWKNLRAITDTE